MTSLIQHSPARHADHKRRLVGGARTCRDAEACVPAPVDAFTGVLEVQLHTLRENMCARVCVLLCRERKRAHSNEGLDGSTLYILGYHCTSLCKQNITSPSFFWTPHLVDSLLSWTLQPHTFVGGSSSLLPSLPSWRRKALVFLDFTTAHLK